MRTGFKLYLSKTGLSSSNYGKYELIESNKGSVRFDLLKYLIKTYNNNKREVVLDNVIGSGSTGMACI